MNTSLIKKGGNNKVQVSKTTLPALPAAKLSEKSKLRVTGGHKADGSFIKDGRVAREHILRRAHNERI